MKLIARPRAAGKTTELLHLMNTDTRYVMIVHTRDAAQWTQRLARDLGYDIPLSRFRLLTEALEVRHGDIQRKYLVDNADLVLQGMLGDVLALSVTDENAEPIEPALEEPWA